MFECEEAHHNVDFAVFGRKQGARRDVRLNFNTVLADDTRGRSDKILVHVYDCISARLSLPEANVGQNSRANFQYALPAEVNRPENCITGVVNGFTYPSFLCVLIVLDVEVLPRAPLRVIVPYCLTVFLAISKKEER